MKTKSVSLRKKFVRQILLVFLIVLIFLFFAFAFLMQTFFSNTVSELDVMENKLIAEDTNVQIAKYTQTTESLSQNANLIDMLIQCRTPEDFNTDHNFSLVAESLKRAQSALPKNEQIWVFSLENLYEVRSGGTANQIPLTSSALSQLESLRKNLDTSMIIEYADDENVSVFNIITPITRDGVVYGLAGTSLTIDDLLRELEEKAGINNMFTACSIIVPTLDNDFKLTGYHEFSLADNRVVSSSLPPDFLSDFPDFIRTEEGAHDISGKEYISEIGNIEWYISCFVPDEAVLKVFYESYKSYGFGIYLVAVLAVLLIVWFITLKMTQPIHDLGTLVSNIRNHLPYKRLKGNNEVTQAADSLISFITEHQLLLDDIECLAKGIERGELDRRLKKDENPSSNFGIKDSLNQMLDSIAHILNHIPGGLAIIDEDGQILYLNERLRQIIGLTSERLIEGVYVSQIMQLEARSREKIMEEIYECHRNSIGRESKLFIMGMHIVFATAKLSFSHRAEEKDVFLQVYTNQTDLIEKIAEQEQVFAYFMHLSLVKKEALYHLSRGDFQHASMEIGQRPSVPHLQAVYDEQMETKQAYSDTVNNIENIIQQLSDATQAFANGNLHSFIDAENAKGSYANLVQTANHAFATILNYFQALPIPIRIIGRDYKIKFFNQASYASGFRPGKTIFCYHAYHSETPCEGCPYLTGIDTLSIRESSCEEKGATQYWKIYSNPLKDQDGQIISIMEIRIDETEIVRLKKEADSANMAKSSFIANMSHEIRTPMNAIIGYSQLMELSGNLDKTSMDYVKIIRRSGHHLLGLINDILELSKIEAGKINLLKESFSLHDLLEDVKAMFLPQMQAKNLVFEIFCPSDMDKNVVGDIGKVRQIILNVVSNALKFTQEGHIHITVDTAAADNTHIRFQADVLDTGSGICKKDWEQVFDAFEQTAAGNKSGTGTGLGMAISRNFARMMGGDLTILQSEVGKGTTFRIEVILQKGTDDRISSNSDSYFDSYFDTIQSIDGEYKILITDEDQESRDILQNILNRVGFNVLTTCNVETAFELWESCSPDLIITDLSLKGQNALTLIRKIRLQEKSQHTPVLVLTTRALEQDKETALQAGADLFLTKPFIIGRLLHEIGTVLNICYKCETPNETIESQKHAVKESVSPKSVEEISEAMNRGDFDTVISIANALAPDTPLFASRLEEYADNFDKVAILNLLNDSTHN